MTGACVFGIPDAKWGEAIKAVVEVKPAGRYTGEQVDDFVGSKIARFKRPHVVAFTDALPADGGGRGGPREPSRPAGGARREDGGWQAVYEDLQRASTR